MKRFFFSLLSFLLVTQSNAQLGEGAIAPDFSVQDLNGNTYSLYSMMGTDKAACLDFMATWCGPCWTFKSSGVMEQVYNNLSAQTTVIMLEGDWSTNTNCLYGPSGCNNSTQGNWVAGTPYPIADLSSTNGPSVMSDYQIAFYPTLYVIAPDKRSWKIKSRTYQEYVNWITKSFKLNATASVTHSLCGDNGKVTLATTGGHSVLTYKWSNGATTKDLINLPGGTYGVTVTDLNGYFKEFGPWTVNGPSKRVAVTNSNLTHVNCFGESTGAIEIETDYGTSPYTYNWSNTQSTKDLSNLIAGAYTVTVTDQNNCTTTKNYTLTQPTLLKLTTSAKLETCSEMNGSVLAKATGGVPPYSYDIGFGQQGSPFFEDLSGGKDYQVTVTDSKLCDEVSSVFVDVTIRPIANAGSNKDLECKNGFVLLDGSISDEGPEIIYEWSTIAGRITKGIDEKIGEADLPGRYYIKVSNVQNKCSAIDSVEIIDVREFPNLNYTGDTAINCKYLESNIIGKSLDTQVVFYWKKVGDSIFYEKSNLLKVSDAGNYILHVKDTVNQCITRDTIGIVKDQLKPDAIANPERDLSCTVSEITIDAGSSSTGPNMTYSWSTLNGNIVSGANSLFPLVDKKGDYKLEVFNAQNHCTNTAEVQVQEQTPLQTNFEQNIDNRTVKFQDLTTGLPTKWTWNFGDGGQSSLQNPEHSFASDGEYEVCLSSENDCGPQVYCRKILVGISVSLNLLNYEQRNVSCFGGDDGHIKLNIQGGVPPYHFLWNTSDTSQNLLNLEAGDYDVQISDQQGTKLNKSFTIKQALEIISQNVNITNTTFGQKTGSILLEIFGGVPPYAYKWSNGSIDNPASGLAAGIYNCEVTDANDCIKAFGPYEVKELVSVETPSWLNSVFIAPNPGSTATLFIELAESTVLNWSILNVYGKILNQEVISGKSIKLDFKTEAFDPGIYFINLQSGNKQHTLRWMCIK
ncbi:MAG: T9SS type A sorting domain-containing protein [Saprospiraceae bacterium]|nr:T9SS type A sorting domain-containing protein [Saprospiraceae bacterium]